MNTLGSLARHCSVLLATIAILVPLARVAEAQQGALTSELVKMLEAELSEEVILEWLEATEMSLEALSADDLISLKKAGASQTLLKRLIQLSGEVVSTPSEPGPLAPAPPPPATEEPKESAEVAAPIVAGADAPTTVAISYLSRIEYPDPEWDLYIYFDGMPVTYVTADGVQTKPARREFARQVPPGNHVIRVTQERHVRRGKGWEHWTRVADEKFEFELSAGEPARIEIEFVERMMDYSDPVLFKLVQGDTVVDSGRVGGEAEFWPLLCEDVEASVPEGGNPGWKHRRRLEDCIRWESMWSGSKAPSRREVLDAMSEFAYRPLPKGS